MPKTPSMQVMGAAYPNRVGVMAGGGITPLIGNQPNSIAGLMGWWDFSDITTLFQDGVLSTPVTAEDDLIGSVADKSGNNKFLLAVAVAGTTYLDTARGLYKTGIINGRSVVRTDGAGDSYVTPELGADATEWTCFIVGLRTDGVTQSGGPPGIFNMESATASFIDDGGTSWLWSNNEGGAAPSVSITPTVAHVITIVCYSATSMEFYAEGALTSSIDPSAAATAGSRVRLASRGNGNGQSGKFDIGEVAWYNVALSELNRKVVERYLGNRWGIAVS